MGAVDVNHPKAFVSSTFKDLRSHRAYVISQLRHCGVHVDPMEDWDAATDAPKTFSTDRMDGCDLLVLLIGQLLGYVPPGETRSITQLEYDHARRRGMDILPFLLTNAAAFIDDWPAKTRRHQESGLDASVLAWQNEIQERHGVGFFSRTPESIPIATSVARWLISKRLPLPARLSLGAAVAAVGPEGDVRAFFGDRLDLVNLAFADQMGGRHVVPAFTIGSLWFDYAIVHPVSVLSQVVPSITYVSLKGCHDQLIDGAIGDAMNAIDDFLSDRNPADRAHFSRMVEEALRAREDYRELAFGHYSERAVLVGGRRSELSKDELDVMRRRNAAPGLLRVWTWDTVAEHFDTLLATVRAVY
jgi:Domain of unknown function (DUF4062)